MSKLKSKPSSRKEEANSNSIDAIRKLPWMELRMAVSKQVFEGTFKQEQYEAFLSEVESGIAAWEDIAKQKAVQKAVQDEITRIRGLLAGGGVDFVPNLSNPAMELIWGALLIGNILPVPQGQTLEQTYYWKALINTQPMHDYLMLHAFQLSEIQGVRGGKIKWGPPTAGTQKGGYPAVGFYFSPNFNLCNLDPGWALFLGLSDSKGPVWHEIKHAEGTRETAEQKRVRAEMKAIKDSWQRRTPEDHERLGNLALENSTRHSIFDVTENNYTNGFLRTCKINGKRYNGKINRAITGILGHRVDEVRNGPQWQEGYQPKTQEKFETLRRAIDFCFYQRNGMFEDTLDAWHKMDIHPEWIQATVTLVDGTTDVLSSKDSFKRLQKRCEQLEKMQPKQKDKIFGPDAYAQKVKLYTEKRNKITDQIFTEYASGLLEQMKQESKERSENLKDLMEKLKDLQKQIEKMDETGKQGQRQQQEQEQEQQQQQQGQQQGQGQDQQQGNGSAQTANVDGHGDMPEVDTIPDHDTVPPGGITEEQLQEQFKDAKDIKKLAEKYAKGSGKGGDEEAESQGQSSSQSQDPGQPSSSRDSSEKGGRDFVPSGLNQTLQRAREEGDANEYARLISPFQNEIERVRNQLKALQEAQQDIRTTWTELSAKPKRGGIKGIDTRRVKKLVQKSQRGHDITQADRRVFRSKAEQVQVPTIDVVFLLDLSVSVESKFDLLMTTTAIFYEAAKSLEGLRVSILGMGNPSIEIAKPSDNEDEIGKAIESTRQIKGSSRQDQLFPSLERGIALSSENIDRTSEDTIGATHFFVVSDGGFSDGVCGLDYLKTLTDESPYLTLDCVLMFDCGDPEIKTRIDRGDYKDTVNYQPISAYDFDTKIGEVLEQLLRTRVERSMGLRAITLAQKESQLGRS